MLKRIQDLTEQDKARYFENIKRTMAEEQGIRWSDIESQVRKEIDDTFNDESFARMAPEYAIDAVHARAYFGKDNKPSVIDYILWTGKFVTHSDYVEID